MNGCRVPLALGAAAGVFLAASLNPADTASVTHAGGEGGLVPVDTVLVNQTDNLDQLADVTTADTLSANISATGDIPAFGLESFDGQIDPDFISNIHDFGLFTITTAADPGDDFVAFAIQTPLFTDILTSGADPEGDLGLGDASFGLAGATVNTFESSVFPFLDSTFTLPFPDPFADLFTLLVQLGF